MNIFKQIFSKIKMSGIFKKLIFPLAVYASMVLANAGVHYYNYHKGMEEIQRSCYGPNWLRK